MIYENRLKGHLFQGAVKCMFEHSGYRVVPYGIESTIREIACMSKDEYKHLSFPEAIKLTPDFILLNKDQSKRWLVEVKFRTEYTDEVCETMRKQLDIFREITFVLFIQNPKCKKNTSGVSPSTHIRTIRAYYDNGKAMIDFPNAPVLWEKGIRQFYSFKKVQEEFSECMCEKEEKTLRTTMEIILKLNNRT